ncbi:uncharacterized protein BX663DRAFT_561742 [Cokeromyces recurvatus]|uniref:uncharacterized protein n=1 Tax=Cokeromyces recurvatus TaxID=90255 RepID=UPI0022208AC8|nr:uncharacterized protein BX663DRAFT_561742 [Cokeromyces recurvatus]KAI7902166.1 hypothetical protein BX663DRAFT_561742 [Cokeromyces recurvatus]
MLNGSTNRYSQQQKKTKSVNDTTTDTNNKKKFRWSSCFSSFITKFKKSSKEQQIRLSQSYDNIERKQSPSEQRTLKGTIEVSNIIKHPFLWKSSLSSQNNFIPSPSLSPPPRQNKSKRDSHSVPIKCPLIDPTLTPRVKPKSLKTSRKQPSLLRLSLVDPIQSPDGENNSINTSKIEQSSSVFSSTIQPHPFRSGTLGTDHFRFINSSSHYLSQLDSNRPYSTATSTNTDTSNTNSDEDEEQNKRLSLKERRRRRSPLSFPSTEQLTLVLLKDQTSTLHHDNDKQHQQDNNKLLTQSRQEAMLTLEGKKGQSRIIESTSQEEYTINDKIKYDAAIIAHKKEKNKDSYSYNRKTVLFPPPRHLSITPETPPYHQHVVPSLISAPTTPNSINSSLLIEDYVTQT